MPNTTRSSRRSILLPPHTLVAFGTSSPELAVTIGSAYAGEADMAVGNVVGSNLFNLLVVLGIGSMVSPAGVEVRQGAIAFDIPVMIEVGRLRRSRLRRLRQYATPCDCFPLVGCEVAPLLLEAPHGRCYRFRRALVSARSRAPAKACLSLAP